MYYFLKRNPSRLLTLLLAICMVITMLAGCSRKEENTDPEAGTDNNSVPPGLVEVKPTEEVTEPTETEPLYDNIAYVSFDVDEDGLEVKSAPSSTAKTLGHLDAGTEVEIIKTEPYLGIDWALIREGWVRLEYLDTKNGSNEPDDTDPEETKPQETAPQNTTSIKGTVTSNTGLNIRKEPDGTIIGNYKYGTSITILETRNGWGRTDKGWVSMTYVKTTNGNTTNNQQTNTNTTTDGTAYFTQTAHATAERGSQQGCGFLYQSTFIGKGKQYSLTAVIPFRKQRFGFLAVIGSIMLQGNRFHGLLLCIICGQKTKRNKVKIAARQETEFYG